MLLLLINCKCMANDKLIYNVVMHSIEIQYKGDFQAISNVPLIKIFYQDLVKLQLNTVCLLKQAINRRFWNN